MTRYLYIIVLILLAVNVLPAVAENVIKQGCRERGECCNSRDGQCDMQNRGWCGKRKGDFYGMRRPVTSLDEARERLVGYFGDRKLTVSEVTEKQWHFEADVLDAHGKVVDRVMIDKRSGRVRSIY